MDNIILSETYIIGLIAAYRKAIKAHRTTFKYQGREFLTAYAKYFLIHWAPQFNLEFKP